MEAKGGAYGVQALRSQHVSLNRGLFSPEQTSTRQDVEVALDWICRCQRACKFDRGGATGTTPRRARSRSAILRAALIKATTLEQVAPLVLRHAETAFACRSVRLARGC